MSLDFQLAVLQAELGRMNAENQRLRGMLNQVTTNYNALQVHLLSLMQNQKADNSVEAEEKKPNNGNGSQLVVPRQFMDLGLAANGDAEEPSQSSSDERSREQRSGSGDNGKISAGHVGDEGLAFDQDKKEFVRGVSAREESPEQQTQSWGPNKVPRLNSPKEVDQTEATMRKARVSVRARSEAPMVIKSLISTDVHCWPIP